MITELSVGTNKLEVVKKDGFIENSYMFKDGEDVIFDTQFDDCICFDFDGFRIYHSRGDGPYKIEKLPETKTISKLEEISLE